MGNFYSVFCACERDRMALLFCLTTTDKRLIKEVIEFSAVKARRFIRVDGSIALFIP